MSGNASGRICILTDALHENVYHTLKKAGPCVEAAFGALRRISHLCNVCCLNKAAGSLMARRLSNFTAPVWFVFLVVQSTLNSLSLSLCIALLSRPLVAP